MPRDLLVEGAPVPDKGQRIGVGELLVFLELRLDAFQLRRLVAERAHDLLALVDRGDGRDRHHADDLLQQVLADDAAAVQALGGLVEHAAVFLEMPALMAQNGGDFLEFPGDRLAGEFHDPGAVIVGEKFPADPVEFVLRRPLAQRHDFEAELVVRTGKGFVENLVVARQSDDPKLAHRRDDRGCEVGSLVGWSACRLHRHSTSLFPQPVPSGDGKGCRHGGAPSGRMQSVTKMRAPKCDLRLSAP